MYNFNTAQENINKIEGELRSELEQTKKHYNDRMEDKEDQYGYREEEIGKYRIKIQTLENVLVKFNRIK